MVNAADVIARSKGNISGGAAFVILLVLLGIALLVWYFGKNQRIKREIASAQRWPIAELPDSTIGRIVGVAKPIGVPLTSPLGGRECVYYLAIVTTGGKHPTTIIREERGVPCEVQDTSGRAIVDVDGAELVLGEDCASTSGSFDDPTAAEQAFLERHDEKGTGMFFNRALVYRETTIAVGETIAVLGAGVREPDPDAPPTDAYRGAPAMRLRLSSTPRWKLRISDHRSTTT